jgi:hypothetical protein
MDERTRAFVSERRGNLEASLAQADLELMRYREQVAALQHARDQVIGQLTLLDDLETELSRPATAEPPAAEA